MIAMGENLLDIDKARQIEFCEFPGGYRPSDNAGDCTFDAEWAKTCVDFAPRYLQHVKSAKGGQPLCLAEWQQNYIGTLFGWMRADGTRRYRISLLAVPRGNGKSTMCLVVAGILLYLDDEPGADIISAAGTRSQAKEVFDPFKANVLTNQLLKRESKCYVNSIVRIDKRTGMPCGVYKAIAAEAGAQHGGSPHGIIFDELHVQPNRELWDVLETGKIKRREPLTAAITTAGYDRHSICYEVWDYAERVRDGVIDDPEFLPVIYAASDEDDWTDPATWRKANPNIGESIAEESLAKECKRAKDVPAYENTFKRLHLNIWTDAESRWLTSKSWDACDMGNVDLKGRKCFGGLDLSSTQDLSALVLVFPDESNNHYDVLCRFWVPQETLQQRIKSDRAPFDVWQRRGLVTATPGNVVDYEYIKQEILRLAEDYDIQQIAFDKWNAMDLVTRLQREGLEFIEFSQGIGSFSGPTKDVERLVLGERMNHQGNPVLSWCVGNTVIESDAYGNQKPSKKKSTERIDGTVALIMAISRAQVGEVKPRYDYYEHNELELG